jgi:hypothetical protein
MRLGVHRWAGLLVACALTSGCLLNSVHSIKGTPQTKPDAAHAIAVVGIGLDVTWPYSGFPVRLTEYSSKQQKSTGTCFHFNRIEAVRPSSPAKVNYLAFEVPANVYTYVDNAYAPLGSSPLGHAFIAPPGGTVYFGDYVLVDDKHVEFRRDLEAARAGAKRLLPRGAVLQPAAATTTAPGAHMPICTP